MALRNVPVFIKKYPKFSLTILCFKQDYVALLLNLRIHFTTFILSIIYPSKYLLLPITLLRVTHFTLTLVIQQTHVKL